MKSVAYGKVVLMNQELKDGPQCAASGDSPSSIWLCRCSCSSLRCALPALVAFSYRWSAQAVCCSFFVLLTSTLFGGMMYGRHAPQHLRILFEVGQTCRFLATQISRIDLDRPAQSRLTPRTTTIHLASRRHTYLLGNQHTSFTCDGTTAIWSVLSSKSRYYTRRDAMLGDSADKTEPLLITAHVCSLVGRLVTQHQAAGDVQPLVSSLCDESLDARDRYLHFNREEVCSNAAEALVHITEPSIGFHWPSRSRNTTDGQANAACDVISTKSVRCMWPHGTSIARSMRRGL